MPAHGPGGWTMNGTGSDGQGGIPDEDRLFSEATAWFFRLRADDHTAAERVAFTRWRDRSPSHARAWDEVQGLLDALKEPARAAYAAAPPPAARPGPRWGWRRLAPAALVLALTLGAMGAWRGPALYQNAVADYATAIGQRLAVQLPDGSQADVNGDTAIALDFADGHRRVRLLRGEAWFNVIHDPVHPFVVETGAGAVRVLGTQFSVRRAGDRMTVVVGEGLVEVAAHPGGPDDPWDGVRLHPGESVETGPAGLGAVQPIDAGVVFAWRRGQVVFRQQTLASVIAELNRHWPGRVLLLNDEAAGRVVSGVFALDRPAAVFDALEKGIGVRTTRITPYLTLLR